MSNMNLTKRIGNTSFKVRVRFSENATETMEEKFIIRVSQMSRSA